MSGQQTVSDSSVESQDNDAVGATSTRRNVLRVGAAGAVMLGAGVNPALAQDDGDDEISLDYDNELVLDPWVTGSHTVEEHVGGRSDLAYTDDEGEESNLADHGYVLAESDDDEDDPEAVNPVTFQAANILADEFTDFPRGETYENDDGDDEDVSALDATHWEDDGITTDDGSDDSLTLEGSSDGDTTRFEEVDIGSGIDRKRLQIVVDVDEVEDTVEIRIEDSSEDQKVAKIDPDGDADDDDVLIDSEGDSRVGQVALGDLDTDLDDIVAIEIASVGGASELTIHGLNLDRESEWEFGEEQIVNDDDDELDTETVTEPDGDISIESLNSLPDYFSESDIKSVEYDIEIRASELPDSQAWVRSIEADDVSSYDRILQVYYEFESASAYDLENGELDDLLLVSEWPSDRLDRLDVADGYDSLDPDEDDWDDVDNISWTDKTEDISQGDEEELLSGLSNGDIVGFRAEIPMSDDRVDELSESMSSAAVSSSGSGPLEKYGTLIYGGLVGGLVVFRKQILGFLGR